MLENSPSRSLRLYGQAQLVVQIILGAIGFMFCLFAAISDGPVMNPATYGDLVTSVEAEVWSWPIFGVSLLYILGILINGNWRWSPALRLAGAAFHTFTLMLFAVLSMQAESAANYVEPLPLLCVVGTAFNAWFFVLNWKDLASAIRGAR